MFYRGFATHYLSSLAGVPAAIAKEFTARVVGWQISAYSERTV
jgi:hypothetical protein